MPTVATVPVYDYINDSSGNPIPNADVYVTLNFNQATSASPVTNVEAVQQKVTTGPTGMWTVNVVPVNKLSPSGCLYNVRTPYQSYDINPTDVNVPVGPPAGWQSSSILVTVPPGLGPTLPNFNVSGILTAGSIQVTAGEPGIDTVGAGVLEIGGDNATTVELGHSGVLVDANGNIAGGSLTLGTSPYVPLAIPGEVYANDLRIIGLTGATATGRFVGHTLFGPPTTGTFQQFDWVISMSSQDIWECTAAGTPGTWRSRLGTAVANLFDYGAKGDAQTVADGAMNGTTGVLTSASNRFVATDVGKTVCVNGAGAAGVALSTTIASYQSAGQVTCTAVSGTAVTNAPVVWGTDDTAAIQAAITALAPATPIDNQRLFTNFGGVVSAASASYLFTANINVWPGVNIVGTGKEQTVFFAGNPSAQFTWPNQAPNLSAATNYGGRSQGFSIHGNNITTNSLATMTLCVSRSFVDMSILWGASDGLTLSNVQNTLFEEVDLEANGNTTTITGTNLVLTNGTSGNVFIRCEFNQPAQYNLKAFNGSATIIDRNAFFDCIWEYFKGKYAGNYYASPIAPVMLAHILLDGANASNPYLIFVDSNVTLNGTQAAIPAIKIINGTGWLVLDSCQVQGNISGSPKSSAAIQLGPNAAGTSNNIVTIYGDSRFSWFSKLYDTYGTHVFVKDYSQADLSGANIDTVWTNDSAILQENAAQASFENTIDMRSGHLKFPGTQNASANATTLDDYQEEMANSLALGVSFGGSSTGITYGSQSGFYLKIGRFVFFVARTTLTSKGVQTGAALITGLPYTGAAGTLDGSVSLANFANLATIASGSWIVGKVLQGTTTLALYVATATAGNTQFTDAYFTNTTDLQLAGFYLAGA